MPISPVFAILTIANGYTELDRICYTLDTAKREQRDLIKMDCGKIVIREFADETAVYDWYDNRKFA